MTRPRATLHPIDRAIGLRIRLAREQRGLTQTQLGQVLGVTYQQVQKYERGANRISSSSLVKLASTLGTSVASLTGEGPSGASASTQALELMAHPLAAQLLAAYAAVELPEDRSLILRLAEALSRQDPDWAGQAGPM